MAEIKTKAEAPEVAEDAETSNAPFADPIGANTAGNKEDFESVTFPEKHFRGTVWMVHMYYCG